jgi:predicted component of type VI protein secretion system
MITITVTAHNAKALSQPLSANFDESGGTIGRAPENTLVLLDPDRKISRTHATVAYRDGRYVLCDHGSVVPVVLNAQPLGNGREVPIKGGDEICIGAYTLGVTCDEPEVRPGTAAAAPAAETSAAPAAPPAPPAPVASADEAAPGPTMDPVLSWASEAAIPGEGITTIVLTAADGGASARQGEEAAAGDAPPAAAPAAAAAAPRAPAQPAAPAPPSAPVANEVLLRALLEGAGLRDVEIPGGLAPDVEAALKHLLVPRGRGFMPPLRAVTDAYDDLRSHHQGFMAGMRSSLAIVVARFDPAALEKRMSEHSMVDSFLPSNRKAKLWDQFAQLYGEISREAETDFQSLFGEEFLRAYREHATKAPAPGNPAAGH